MKDNDLISRQSLLNSLNRFAPEHFNALVNDLIMKEPAADHIAEASKKVTQPELAQNLHTTCTDTISRQAAIDEIRRCRFVVDAIEKISKLPSAQPERTCVNCGRTINNGGWYADGRTRCPIEEHYALPKDGYCHLWEKRNVTDDDYPERRTDE